MKTRYLTFLTAAVVALGALTTHAWADPSDRKTIITVNESILIPGKVLPPGKYVMKLLDSMANRNIVQIFNEDQSKLEATILAFNNYRLQPTDKTEFRYWETPAGSPPALRAWFYPGDLYGQEFAYPRDLAEVLARENRTTVPTYESASASMTPEQLGKLEVRNVPPAQDTQAATPAETRTTTPPSNMPAENRSDSSAAAVTVPAPAQTQAQDRTVLAQAIPPPAPAAGQTDPSPVASESSELPQTASTLPWMLSIGILVLFAAGAMTFRRV